MLMFPCKGTAKLEIAVLNSPPRSEVLAQGMSRYQQTLASRKVRYLLVWTGVNSLPSVAACWCTHVRGQQGYENSSVLMCPSCCKERQTGNRNRLLEWWETLRNWCWSCAVAIAREITIINAPHSYLTWSWCYRNEDIAVSFPPTVHVLSILRLPQAVDYGGGLVNVWDHGCLGVNDFEWAHLFVSQQVLG